MKRITIILVLAGLPLCGCEGGKDYTSETEKAANVYNLIKSPKFPFSDLLADVDAKNMSRLYSAELYLSNMFSDYYVNGYTNCRFTMFVDGFGGVDGLYPIVLSYTYGCEIPKHLILILNSAIRRGAMITVEEGYALHFGFMNFMEDMLNEENGWLPYIVYCNHIYFSRIVLDIRNGNTSSKN